jgi:hypothetical protein
MSRAERSQHSRRDFLKLAAVTAAVGPFFAFPQRALASQKTLSIVKWAHFVPEFDSWFEGMAEDWGTRHDTKVIVDRVPVEEVPDVQQPRSRLARVTTYSCFPGRRLNITST